MQRLRNVTSLDVSAVAGHHAVPAGLLFSSALGILFDRLTFFLKKIIELFDRLE